jgi:hypothetical protein
MFVAMAVFMVCDFAVSAVTFGFGSLCLFPLIIPLAILAFSMMEQGMAAVLADDLGVTQALQRAWDLVKKNLLTMGLMSIIIHDRRYASFRTHDDSDVWIPDPYDAVYGFCARPSIVRETVPHDDVVDAGIFTSLCGASRRIVDFHAICMDINLPASHPQPSIAGASTRRTIVKETS